MRAYRIKLNGKVRFAASNDAATKVKQEMNVDAGFSALARQATVTPVEVPTDKAGLIEWLNTFAKEMEPEKYRDIDGSPYPG